MSKPTKRRAALPEVSMRRYRDTIAVAVLLGLVAAAPATAQVRDRYDNSIDMRAPLSRQQQNTVINNQRRDLPDSCYSSIATDRSVACTAPTGVVPLPASPGVPCTPQSALANPALGPLPGTCR